MDFDLDAWIDENLDAHGDLEPPWARYPEIGAGSIGWRMGGGEGWWHGWSHWLCRLPDDQESRVAYLRRHPPAPRSWSGSVVSVLDPSLSDDGDMTDEEDDRWTAVEAVLEREGLLGDDVAIIAWLARGEPLTAPWVAERDIATMTRYGARGLTFFVRWAAKARREGRLEAWLSAAGQPSRRWTKFVETLRRGALSTNLPRDAREQLALFLAVRGGWPPLPWTRGEAPAAMARRFKDTVPYAGAWAEWAGDVFDDRTTFSAYLATGPQPSTAWRQALEEALPWLLE